MLVKMRNHGFIRVAACKPTVRIGDVNFNYDRIAEIISEMRAEHVRLCVFPELCITGYTCADLFFQSSLLDQAYEALLRLKDVTMGIAVIVGIPLRIGPSIYNCGVLIDNGRIMAVTPKKHLPNYNEFYERRWFAPAPAAQFIIKMGNQTVPFGAETISDIDGIKVGMEICEDLWVPNPPSASMCMKGAEIIANLSASNEQAGKHAYLVELIRQQSARCRAAYVYASAGEGESSTDLAFSGNCIIAEDGSILAEGKRFSLEPEHVIADIDVEMLRNDRLKYNTFSDDALPSLEAVISPDEEETTLSNELQFDILKYRKVNPLPFVEKDDKRLRERCDEISSIQAWGLARRLRAIGCKTAVIGISGGLDSTLALLVTVKAFDMLGLDRKGIIGITMPGFGTTKRTHGNAWNLMQRLAITSMEIPIARAVEIHFQDIGQDPNCHDATYENSQARERTQILMDMANKTGGIVIGTGDLSELALGWCTYNGDQMSMYGVNASIPKTLVRDLVKGYMLSHGSDISDILADIIDTPISPELLPASSDGNIAQKTEDFVGPYELHDFFLHAMLRHSFGPAKIFLLATKAFDGTYSPQIIRHWMQVFYKRFFSQQFKRSCMPDGVKVGSVCLSPRGDWRMPSDACVNLWLDELNQIDA